MTKYLLSAFMTLAVCGSLTAAGDSTVLLPLGLFHVPGAFGGTELPVVRANEFTSSLIELLNIPVTPGFRFTVRVYALDGDVPIQAVARIYDPKNGQLIGAMSFVLARAADQSPAYYPAYAQLDQLGDHLAGLTGDTVVVEISPSQAGQQLWAFASITNNETQDVTTVTPQ